MTVKECLLAAHPLAALAPHPTLYHAPVQVVPSNCSGAERGNAFDIGRIYTYWISRHGLSKVSTIDRRVDLLVEITLETKYGPS